MTVSRVMQRALSRRAAWSLLPTVLLGGVACGPSPEETAAPTTPTQPSALKTTPASPANSKSKIENPKSSAPDAELIRHDAPKRIVIKPSDLPQPYATRSARNESRVIVRPEGAKLSVPPGFTIEEWASDLDNPRIITVAPNGDVFVAESGPNRVRIIRPGTDGKPAQNQIFADGLRQPFGIAFYPPGPNPTHVYVANTDSIVRFPYKNGDLKARGEAETVIPDLPGGGYHQHWTRDIVFRPDGKKLYFSVGSRSNVGEEPAPRASITECNPDGTERRTFASGIRNPVGLAFNPVSGGLWTSVNERDELGDDLVPDYATSVKDGGFYGWPYYYIGPNHDPRMPERPDLKAKTIVPDILFQSHVASLALTFYSGKRFPVRYRNWGFAAHHGSWNRAVKSGYEVVALPMTKSGQAAGGFEPFVTGWATPEGKVWGRPVGVAVANDGSLLITDDGAGKIWRVRYVGDGSSATAAR